MTNRTLNRIIKNAGQNAAVELLGSDRLKDLLTDVYTDSVVCKLTERVAYLFSNKRDIVPFTMTQGFSSKTKNWINQNDYLNLAEISVYAPVGLKCSLIEYIEALEKTLSHMVGIETELLDPILASLGTYLNSPQQLKSSSFKVKGKLLNIKVDDVSAPVAKLFDPREKSDTIPYKQAFRRNGDLEVVSERLMALQDNINRVNTKSVEEKVSEIFKQVKYIVDTIKSDEFEEEFGEVSKNTTRQMADVVYQAATWVEYFAVFQHQLLTLSTAMADTDKKIQRLAK